MRRLSDEERQRRIAERTARFNEATDREIEELRRIGMTECQYIATLDDETCEACGRLDGMHIPLDQARRGVNLPCMHPGCRCTVACVIPPKYRSGNERRSARTDDGGWGTVPASMT